MARLKARYWRGDRDSSAASDSGQGAKAEEILVIAAPGRGDGAAGGTGCPDHPPSTPGRIQRPTSRLQAARRLREAEEELEAAQVQAARKAGATWIEIGACYGLTKQGAQQRFRGARNHAKGVTAASTGTKADPGA